MRRDQPLKRTEASAAVRTGVRVGELAVAAAIVAMGAILVAPTVATDAVSASAYIRCPNEGGCTASNHNQVLL